MSEQSDIEKRTLTLTRTFNAPRSLVWEAWTQPEHIAKWWGPNGMQTTIKKHNFQEGGEWEFAMTMPNGGEFITNGTYVKIVPPELIETNADFKPMTEGVYLIIQLEESGADQTAFTFKVVHPTEEYCKQQEEMGFYNGWGSVFDNLAAYVIDLK